MNFAWAPDNEWDYIAELTGDKSWGHKHMRKHLMDLENCTYVPRGTRGHGFEGYIEVKSTHRVLPYPINRLTSAKLSRA
jgi:choline dehydrogenase